MWVLGARLVRLGRIKPWHPLLGRVGAWCPGLGFGCGEEFVVGFTGGFEQAGLDGCELGIAGCGEFVDGVGGEVGVVGDGAVQVLVLEVGVVADDGRAGLVDASDVLGGLAEGIGVDDCGELGECEVVDLADLDGRVGGFEDVVEEGRGEGGKRGIRGRGAMGNRDL